MIRIHLNTKIATLIKANPKCIDAIASINVHFKKLHNPVLRKILAARVTIADAARIGNVDIQVFYKVLEPLGFLPDEEQQLHLNKTINSTSTLYYDKLLDVRSDLSSGIDPFKKIMQEVNNLTHGESLLLINSFEPTPLIRILEKKGYEIHTSATTHEEIHTHIKCIGEAKEMDIYPAKGDFGPLVNQYEGKMTKIDVRSLPMPQPMMMILQQLESLPVNEALFVQHKKLPMFLFPELKERKFLYTYEVIEDGILLLIYKDNTARS